MADEAKPSSNNGGGRISISVCVVGLLLVLIAVYAATDPLKLSPFAYHPNFQTHRIELPAWNEWPRVSDPENKLQKSEIRFINQVHGPESMQFDASGKGPYTGIADGRIMVWDGSSWSYFAHTSPNRSDELCNGNSPFSNVEVEHICGRPLGLRFDKKTGDLYIADAYFGLLVVGPEGGLATRLLAEIDGIPLKFCNDLDIDSEGIVYFTDSSATYPRRNFIQLAFSGDSTGRIIRFDTKTKETSVIARNIAFSNGLSLSKDESFFVYCEGSTGYLLRHWVRGPQQGTTETFAVLPGHPDNIRTNEKGEFWVAVHSRRTLYSHFLGLHPALRKLIMRLPISYKFHYLAYLHGSKLHAMVIKYSADGEILHILEDSNGKTVRAVSEAEEHAGHLWMGSVLNSFIAVYPLTAKP